LWAFAWSLSFGWEQRIEENAAKAKKMAEHF